MQKSPSRRVRRALASGWAASLFVYVVAVVALHAAAVVSLRDIAAFTAYVLGWLTLPGTLTWRAVDRSGTPRPLLADLALGTAVGYVLEVPVYAAAVASGHPRAYLLWPVVALLATLTHRRGRALWRRPTTPTPAAWNWSMAGLMTWILVWLTEWIWVPHPAAGRSADFPYVDLPYHLMLSAELRHHFPPEASSVVGSPLYYHWLANLHMAAASWISGTEITVLLAALALPTAFIVGVLALGAAAARLTGWIWAVPVAIGLTMVGPLALKVTTNALLDTHLEDSPSAGYVTVSLALGLALCLELFTGRLRGPAAYALTLLTFVVMFGSKSTSLPCLAAGLVAAVIWRAVRARRVPWAGAALTLTAGIVYLVAKPFFFGGGTGGLGVRPLAFFLPASPLSTRAVLAVLLLLSYAGLALPVAVALRRGLDRSGELVLLAGTVCAGFAATLVFHQESRSEWYFLYVVLGPLVLATTLALHRLGAAGLLSDGHWQRRTGYVLVAACGTAAVAAYVLTSTRMGHRHGLSGHLVAAAIALAVGALIVAVARWAPSRGVRPRLLAAVLAVGLGLGCAGVDHTARLLVHPLSRAADSTDALIGAGGIPAARWLRAHSGPDDLVATNAHCERPVMRSCTERNFWMAGYSERRFLVEGWSYIVRSTSAEGGPFWDLPRLTANDEAFQHPSVATVGLLRSTWGVRWLFVDRRYPNDLPALNAVVAPVFDQGDYAIYRLN